MKAWQRAAEGALPSRKPSDPTPFIQRMVRSFEVQPRFWSSVGALRGGILQFRLTGAEIEDWFVELDASGGKVLRGVHREPNTEWCSSAADLTAVLRGEAAGDLLSGGRVRLSGDLDLFLGLLEGLRAAV